MDDLAYAARTLTQYGPDGATTQPGLISLGNQVWLFRSLLGQGFYDDTTFPETPDLTNPALADILTTWAELQEEGVMSFPGGFISSGSDSPIPMRIDRTYDLALTGGQDTNEQGTPAVVGTYLPGGAVGLIAQGLVVSGGTQYPELAYALARHLTQSATLAYVTFNNTLARQSLAGTVQDDAVYYAMEYGPENQAFLEQAVWEALPYSALRYSEYISHALIEMEVEGLDLQAALEAVEMEAVVGLEVATEHGAQTVIEVATPVPTPVLAPGEVAITFGLIGVPLPTNMIEEQMQPIIDEFLANDPEVRQLVLDAQVSVSPYEWADVLDCFYTSYFPSEYEDANVLSLDPFLDADPDFDRGDVFNGVLAQLQAGNRTWGLPMTLQPSMLIYDSTVFTQAGVPLPDPEAGWTTDQFIDALHRLKDYLPADIVPFQPQDGGQGNYLLALIAAFGGLPLDHRTMPVTVNFTAPETVEAIRQVLDLAREGYMDYTQLVNPDGGAIYGGSETVPLATVTEWIVFSHLKEHSEQGASRQPVTYPVGSSYTPVMYGVGAGYISANASNPEACYRWLSHLAQYPYLLSGMPVRRAQIDDPTLEAARGPDEVAFYRQFDAALQSPGVVIFDTYSSSDYNSNLIQYWLFGAFDAYVLEDADLELILAEAETKALAYLACAADIPPIDYNLDAEAIQAQAEQYIACVSIADPELAEQLLP
jgi:ABC-type glycerol-3-phosphate transport system substrate-binding protein